MQTSSTYNVFLLQMSIHLTSPTSNFFIW